VPDLRVLFPYSHALPDTQGFLYKGIVEVLPLQHPLKVRGDFEDTIPFFGARIAPVIACVTVTKDTISTIQPDGCGPFAVIELRAGREISLDHAFQTAYGNKVSGFNPMRHFLQGMRHRYFFLSHTKRRVGVALAMWVTRASAR